MKVILLGALPESLINFRGELIRAMVANKHEVVAMASEVVPGVVSRLETMGATFRAYPVNRTGLSVAGDYRTWKSLRATFEALKPDVILAYTIKPVIWGGFASRVLPDVRFYGLITGLGFALEGKGIARGTLALLVRNLYKISLKRAEKVIFQNPDNLDTFVGQGIVPASKCEVVNGSGVDLDRFRKEPFSSNPAPVFLMIGRLLGDKGVREYVAAARLVKQKYPHAVFRLIGPLESSPDAISRTEVDEWIREGAIDYLGAKSDVRPELKGCDIYVLPSYHEGTPRTVLEAMAIGRPVLTTDVPGCRETVEPGRNGFLVEKADEHSLAERMIWFIENPQRWSEMGQKGREIAEEKYDVRKVNSRLLEIMGLA